MGSSEVPGAMLTEVVTVVPGPSFSLVPCSP
jgi:hypothetical protein